MNPGHLFLCWVVVGRGVALREFARACTTQLANFKLNTRKRGAIHNEHSIDEGLSRETSEHFLYFDTFSNILIFYFSLRTASWLLTYVTLAWFDWFCKMLRFPV